MKLIENIDYSWENVGPRILTLRGRLGFGEKIEFIYLEIQDSGEVLLNDPRDSQTHQIKDEYIIHFVYKILFYYSTAGEHPPTSQADEKFTKISLLDDSMYLGCSTNQHRLEKEFCNLFDKDQEQMAFILENYFQGTDAHKGDASFRVQLLPRVPALLVYYMAEDSCVLGDEFIPSSLTIFFEKNTNKFLPPNVCETLEDVFLFVLKKFI
ncbi:MAG: DUF3786 domain-containing protein [Candidatus Hodarchaeota archaeon]